MTIVNTQATNQSTPVVVNFQALLDQKAQLDMQSAALEKQLQDARTETRNAAIASIKQLMLDNNLAVRDINFKAVKMNKVNGNSGQKIAVKYLDKNTGKTWTGRGMTPRWISTAISAGQKIEDFAV